MVELDRCVGSFNTLNHLSNKVFIPNKAVDLNLCDEIIKSYDEEIKVIHTNFNEKKVTFKTQNLQILLAFLLITIALLIAVSIYFV